MKTAHQNAPKPATTVDVANKSYVDTAVGGAGVAIGSTVSGGTAGSLLFIGTGPVLAQNNTRLFWDNTNFRLGIGTSVPGTTLDVVGASNTSAVALYGGSSAPVSAASTGRIRFNEGTNKFQVSENGAAYADILSGTAVMSIGEAIGSATAGSVLFVGTGPVLAQDNANLFYDNTNKRLGIGTASPATKIHTKATVSGNYAARFEHSNTAGYAGAEFYDSTPVQKGAVGYGNSAVGNTFLQSLLHLYSAGPDWVIANATAVTHQFGVTAGAVFVGYTDGASAAVSAASAGRIRYNNSTSKFQVSTNGGAYQDLQVGAETMAIGEAVGSGTTGSVLFVGAGPVLAQDNGNFFWDNTNKRLGIGTASPGLSLDVRNSAATDVIKIENASATGFSTITWFDNSDVQKGSFGYANSSAAVNAGTNFIYTPGGFDFIWTDNTTVWFRYGLTTNSVFAELANGSSSAISAANKGRLRYNTTGQKAQWSFNGGSYFDAATYAAALTTGSVLFANASNQIAQDNATFFWDNTNKSLRVGASAVTQAFTSFPLTVSCNTTDIVSYMWNTNVAGYSAIGFLDNALTYRAIFGYGNASTSNGFTSHAFVDCNSVDFVIIDGNTGNAEFQFGTTDNATFLQMNNGSSAAVSPANKGRLRYNTTGQKSQLSFNGGSYFDVGTYAAALTTGSVLFANASNQIAQNNANFNWDNTNNTLNLTGGSASAFALDIFGLDTSGNHNTVRISNNAGSFGLPALQFDRASVNTGTVIGFDSLSFGLVNGLTMAIPSGKNFGVRIGASVSTSTVMFIDPTNSYIFSNLSVGHQNSPANVIDARASVSGGGIVRVQNTSATGFSDILFYNESSVLKGAVGYANASETAVSSAAGLNILYTEGATPADWAMINGTANKAEFRWGMTDGSIFVEQADGASAAVSSANTGRIRYNNSSKTFQVSLSGSAYVDLITSQSASSFGRLMLDESTDSTVDWGFPNGMSIGASVQGATSGSLLFAGTSSGLAQDNANLFWGTTNKQLGLGTNVFTSNAVIGGGVQPGLEVVSPTGIAPQICMTSYSSTQSALLLGFRSRGSVGSPSPVLTGDTLLNITGYGQQNSTVGHVVSGGRILITPAEDWSGTAHGTRMGFGVVTNTTTTMLERMAVENDGGISFNNSSTAAVSAASEVRLRNSSNTLQVSKNTGAYVTIFDTAGTGLSSSGSSVSLANTTVVPGTYANPTITVDSQGRITYAAGGGAALLSPDDYVSSHLEFSNQQMSIGMAVGGATAGSLLFAGPSSNLTQNNAKLFWDDTNFRLGIRTASPAHALDVQGGSINLKTHTGYAGSDVVTGTFAVQTTSATTLDTTIFTMVDNTVFRVIYEVIGRDEAGVERALLGRAALVYRQGGGATIQAENSTFSDIFTTSVTAAVTVSSNDVRISITGLASTTIDWVVHMRYQALATSA